MSKIILFEMTNSNEWNDNAPNAFVMDTQDVQWVIERAEKMFKILDEHHISKVVDRMNFDWMQDADVYGEDVTVVKADDERAGNFYMGGEYSDVEIEIVKGRFIYFMAFSDYSNDYAYSTGFSIANLKELVAECTKETEAAFDEFLGSAGACRL